MRKHTKTMAVSVQPTSANRKLSPVRHERAKNGRQRPIPMGPMCSSTMVSIQATCPDSCTFKNNNGCFAESGITGKVVADLDGEAKHHEMTGIEVASVEARAIDDTFPGGVPQDGGRHGKSGRDLRLHISGDVADEASAMLLAGAASRWMARGGGRVWAYTHRWREIAREAWGSISILASCETPADTEAATARGYAVALVVRSFNGARKVYAVPGMAIRILPCPAETSGSTCVQCRLCLDATPLTKRGLAIGFSAHGRDETKAVRRLPILDSLFGTIL